MPCPVVFGGPQGRSGTFTDAQTYQTAPSLASFFVYRISNYAVASITNELLEATRDNAAAFIDEGKLVMDTAVRNITNDLALDLYKDGSGARGSISSISTGVITLADANSVVNFEVGMVLVAFSVSGQTYTQSTSSALGYVIAVNRYAGTITVSATEGGAAGTPTNWSTSFPNLGVKGDVTFGTITATTSFKKVSGLAAWFPSTAPSSTDSFWGVNRSTDSRLYGTIAQNTSTETIEEALIDAASLCAREGGEPNYAFMNFKSYAALEKSLGSKVQYVTVNHDMADIAFKGITINAPYGPITVIPDRNCPSNTAYLLDMETLKFRSLGKAPHILTYGAEGLEALRISNADAVEIRWGYYGNLTCSAPCWNAVVPLSA